MASFPRQQRRLWSQRSGVLHFVLWQTYSNLTQRKCTDAWRDIAARPEEGYGKTLCVGCPGIAQSLRSVCWLHEHPVNTEMKTLLVFGSEIENTPWGAMKHKNKVIKILLVNETVLFLTNNLIVYRRCLVETITLWLCSFTRALGVSNSSSCWSWTMIWNRNIHFLNLSVLPFEWGNLKMEHWKTLYFTIVLVIPARVMVLLLCSCENSFRYVCFSNNARFYQRIQVYFEFFSFSA